MNSPSIPLVVEVTCWYKINYVYLLSSQVFYLFTNFVKQLLPGTQGLSFRFLKTLPLSLRLIVDMSLDTLLHKKKAKGKLKVIFNSTPRNLIIVSLCDIYRKLLHVL